MTLKDIHEMIRLSSQLGRRHVAEGHLNPPPKAQSLVRSVRDINSKSNSKIFEPPPNLPLASNMLLPSHLFTTSLQPFYNLFTTLTQDTANFDSNLVHLESHVDFLMPSCTSMPSACSRMTPTCPILAPSRLPRQQF